MNFKDHVREVLESEISKQIKQQGYVLEADLCAMVREKYNFTMATIKGMLRRIYPGMSLIKRRMSNELKDFYNLEIKGCPVVYMPDTDIGNG